ncbi:SGNH/GDSL hydrolase family protein [Pseudomarimonas salicorniae]|uniref:SGNH/GDSL hydrolase family protein n=1 Tax=Pseudomarimonas salicorniae TaxID=2933270 RepID=A0ABT0GGD6_9GAMM|nr:SGNH/GDSL hydrolase family protein [Lysobacter sp. CAU 1642]MCK7593503.1 SGNH/GDSL hydrolase family protein [Lysobacter sp. CAU 1642]
MGSRPETRVGPGAARPAFDARSLLFWPALPLIAAQGLWLRRTAYRAPPATGAVRGRAGNGPPLHLLALGDSITVGVGLQRLDEALPAQLAAVLSARLEREVHWCTGGRNGATSRHLRRQIGEHGTDLGAADLILISIGVNDATGLRRRARVAEDLDAALDALRAANPRVPIMLAGLPPLQSFPVLPSPLRQLLGLRARQLDGLLAALAQSRAGVLHLPMPLVPAPGQFAADGFHPNAAACRQWAATLVDRLPGSLLQTIAVGG